MVRYDRSLESGREAIFRPVARRAGISEAGNPPHSLRIRIPHRGRLRLR